MNIRPIKDALFKRATVFQTGGIRPTEEMGESWIGKVLWEKENADVPPHFDPLCTLFLKELPYVPQELANYQLLTIYMDSDLFNHLNQVNLASFFRINCHTTLEGLLKINESSTRIKPFPLIPSLIENDAPAWDSDDLQSGLEEEILRLEAEEDVDYYDDIVENIYPVHKVGGYASFIQSGVSFGKEYSFVLQISSDEKARFNIVDSGCFYFFYNPQRQDWIVHCDFY